MRNKLIKIICWSIPLFMFLVAGWALWYKRALLSNPNYSFDYLTYGLAMLVGILLITSTIPSIIKHFTGTKGS